MTKMVNFYYHDGTRRQAPVDTPFVDSLGEFGYLFRDGISDVEAVFEEFIPEIYTVDPATFKKWTVCEAQDEFGDTFYTEVKGEEFRLSKTSPILDLPQDWKIIRVVGPS